ncbi:MAG: ligase-associated DNA damage response endonuclease PdeM [Thainema sp.]
MTVSVTLTVANTQLQLLPEKAAYMVTTRTLFVADVHLGKAETFQAFGLPIASDVNLATLRRLREVCDRTQAENLFILGDLFHSQFALVDEVIDPWQEFLATVSANVVLVVGNHDRKLMAQLSSQISDQDWHYFTDAIQFDSLILSHQPLESSHKPEAHQFTLCGHVHPCLRLKSRLDQIRLPCFYVDWRSHCLILPAFGEFTGGYNVSLSPYTAAYAIADNQVVPFESRSAPA